MLAMLELSRTIRFCLNDPPKRTRVSSAVSDPLDSARDNTFSCWPAPQGLGRYYELDVLCRGEADPQTGYFINIKHIDTAVRERVLPRFAQAVADDPRGTPLGTLLRGALDAVQPALNHSVAELCLALTPYIRLTLRSADVARILLAQQYEFSAAHRLHAPSLTAAENVAVFGKCNNPAGHGHNYRVEVAASAPIDEHGYTLDVAALDAVVDAHCIEHLDHKHLNADVPEFADRNPSVEHIAETAWQMLAAPIAGLREGARLEHVRVWETSKTACTYRGPDA